MENNDNQLNKESKDINPIPNESEVQKEKDSQIDNDKVKPTRSKAVFSSSQDLGTGMPSTLSWLTDFTRRQENLHKPLAAVMAAQASVNRTIGASQIVQAASSSFQMPTALSAVTSALFNNSVYDKAIAMSTLPGQMQWLQDRRLFETNTLLQDSINNKDQWLFAPAQVSKINVVASLMVGTRGLGSFNIYKSEALFYLQTNDATKPLLECMTTLSGIPYLHANKPLEALSAKSLISVNLNNLYSRIDPTFLLKTQLTAKAVDFSLGFSQVSTQTIRTEKQHQFYDISSKDYFLRTQVTEVMSRTDSVTKEKKEALQKIINESNDYIKGGLEEIEPALNKMWVGASQAIYSDNPESARHFSTSVRELINYTLELLAPSHQLEAWITENPDPVYLTEQKKPSRKAMFDFICRNAITKTTKRLIEARRNATLSLGIELNGGVHKLEPGYSFGELLAFKAEAQSNLLFLIQMHREFNV